MLNYIFFIEKITSTDEIKTYDRLTMAAKWITCVGRYRLKISRVHSVSRRFTSLEDRNTHSSFSSFSPWFNTVSIALPTRPLPPVTNIIWWKSKIRKYSFLCVIGLLVFSYLFFTHFHACLLNMWSVVKSFFWMLLTMWCQNWNKCFHRFVLLIMLRIMNGFWLKIVLHSLSLQSVQSSASKVQYVICQFVLLDKIVGTFFFSTSNLPLGYWPQLSSQRGN